MKGGVGRVIPELAVDAVGHDTVDVEGAHWVADVGGVQHRLEQQHPVFFLLQQEGPCRAGQGSHVVWCGF